MKAGDFNRRFGWSLLGLALSWRLFLVLPVRHADSALIALLLGLAPYALLAALAPKIGNRFVLVSAAAAMLTMDLVAALGAMNAKSSTAAVAVMLVPIFSIVLVVPAAVLLGWLARRLKGVCSTIRRS